MFAARVEPPLRRGGVAASRVRGSPKPQPAGEIRYAARNEKSFAFAADAGRVRAEVVELVDLVHVRLGDDVEGGEEVAVDGVRRGQPDVEDADRHRDRGRLPVGRDRHGRPVAAGLRVGRDGDLEVERLVRPARSAGSSRSRGAARPGRRGRRRRRSGRSRRPPSAGRARCRRPSPRRPARRWRRSRRPRARRSRRSGSIDGRAALRQAADGGDRLRRTGRRRRRRRAAAASASASTRGREPDEDLSAGPVVRRRRRLVVISFLSTPPGAALEARSTARRAR